MNFEQAMQVVQQYQQDWRLPALLETLEDMRDRFEELDSNERTAYRVVFREMSKLFAPA